jgi:hypothetical protein
MSRPPSIRPSQNATRISPRAQPNIQKPLDESNELGGCAALPGPTWRKCPTFGVKKGCADPPLPSHCCATETPATVHTHNQNDANKMASVFLAAGMEMRKTPSCCKTVERVGRGEIAGVIVFLSSFSRKSVVYVYRVTLPREMRKDKGTEVDELVSCTGDKSCHGASANALQPTRLFSPVERACGQECPAPHGL